MVAVSFLFFSSFLLFLLKELWQYSYLWQRSAWRSWLYFSLARHSVFWEGYSNLPFPHCRYIFVKYGVASCFLSFFELCSLLININVYVCITWYSNHWFCMMQQRHEVPQNFRRQLSSKLRRLVSQGKLEKVNDLFIFVFNQFWRQFVDTLLFYMLY